MTASNLQDLNLTITLNRVFWIERQLHCHNVHSGEYSSGMMNQSVHSSYFDRFQNSAPDDNPDRTKDRWKETLTRFFDIIWVHRNIFIKYHI